MRKPSNSVGPSHTTKGRTTQQSILILWHANSKSNKFVLSFYFSFKLFWPNRACCQHSHNAIFHWKFHKHSVKILQVMVYLVCLGIPKNYIVGYLLKCPICGEHHRLLAQNQSENRNNFLPITHHSCITRNKLLLPFSDGRTVGSEDCLYLNIYKPAGNKRRAVMMFIHGGGYVGGSANAYPGAPLAVTGDVIVITINYRLGAFGFLTDEQGEVKIIASQGRRSEKRLNHWYV